MCSCCFPCKFVDSAPCNRKRLQIIEAMLDMHFRCPRELLEKLAEDAVRSASAPPPRSHAPFTLIRVRELVRGVWDLYASFVTLSDTCVDLSVSRCALTHTTLHVAPPSRSLNSLLRSLVNLCSASEQAATKCVNDIVDGASFQPVDQAALSV